MGRGGYNKSKTSTMSSAGRTSSNHNRMANDDGRGSGYNRSLRRGDEGRGGYNRTGEGRDGYNRGSEDGRGGFN
jgi:hypothetical protein